MEEKEKRKRPIQKKVRFKQDEMDYINQKIADSPFNNFQNFARILLITGEVKIVDYSKLNELNSQINRIGNNINQIAKLAHQFEEISSEDILNLTNELSSLKQVVKATLKEELKTERTV